MFVKGSRRPFPPKGRRCPFVVETISPTQNSVKMDRTVESRERNHTTASNADR